MLSALVCAIAFAPTSPSLPYLSVSLRQECMLVTHVASSGGLYPHGPVILSFTFCRFSSRCFCKRVYRCVRAAPRANRCFPALKPLLNVFLTWHFALAGLPRCDLAVMSAQVANLPQEAADPEAVDADADALIDAPDNKQPWYPRHMRVNLRKLKVRPPRLSLCVRCARRFSLQLVVCHYAVLPARGSHAFCVLFQSCIACTRRFVRNVVPLATPDAVCVLVPPLRPVDSLTRCGGTAKPTASTSVRQVHLMTWQLQLAGERKLLVPRRGACRCDLTATCHGAALVAISCRSQRLPAIHPFHSACSRSVPYVMLLAYVVHPSCTCRFSPRHFEATLDVDDEDCLVDFVAVVRHAALPTHCFCAVAGVTRGWCLFGTRPAVSARLPQLRKKDDVPGKQSKVNASGYRGRPAKKSKRLQARTRQGFQDAGVQVRSGLS